MLEAYVKLAKPARNRATQQASFLLPYLPLDDLLQLVELITSSLSGTPIL
jgi:hypothetical protein